MEKFSVRNTIDSWEAENVYFLTSHPSRIGKLLAQYEIYKKILDVPGCFMELGVYKGASFVRFATFRSMLENDYARTFFGFDAFGKFPLTNVKSEADRQFINKFEGGGGLGISKDELEEIIRHKKFDNTQFIEGDIFQTIPKFVEENPHLRIALLHLDMDVYEPTKFGLSLLMPLMSRGGLVVFDDYNAVAGATRAADEICAQHGYRLHKFSFYNVPAYFEVA